MEPEVKSAEPVQLTEKEAYALQKGKCQPKVSWRRVLPRPVSLKTGGTGELAFGGTLYVRDQNGGLRNMGKAVRVQKAG